MISQNAPLTLTLSKSDFIQIFKACEDRKERLDRLQSTATDDAVIADAGNDLIEINTIMRELTAKANEIWGVSGWTTSDAYL